MLDLLVISGFLIFSSPPSPQPQPQPQPQPIMTILEVSEDSIQKPTEKPTKPSPQTKKKCFPNKTRRLTWEFSPGGGKKSSSPEISATCNSATLEVDVSMCASGPPKLPKPTARRKKVVKIHPPVELFFGKKTKPLGRSLGPQKGFHKRRSARWFVFGRVFDYIILWCVLHGWQFLLLLSCLF